jgi:hypothetical protein
MLESSFNQNLSENFEGLWVRHENSAMAGTSDVNYLLDCGQSGWLELKVIETSEDYGSIPKVKHLMPEQVNYLFRWSRYGGNAGLLLLVCSGSEREIFLIDGLQHKFLRKLRKQGCSRDELIATASFHDRYHVKKDMSLVLRTVYNR